MQILRATLIGLVDYAGLFPPASLDLGRVLQNHASYADGPDRWMLGRLILPLGRLDEAADLIARMDRREAHPWTVSALASTGDALDRIGDRVLAFNERHAPVGIAIVAVECPAQDPRQVAAAARAIPDWLERYMETAGDEDMLDAIAGHGCYAKLRTGGVVAQAFPSSEHLAGFVMACAAREVPFKATAGLHHPLRGRYPLTYAAESDTAVMHGFVNLVLAAASARTGRADLHDSAATLELDRPTAFAFSGDTAAWGRHSISLDEIVQTRAHLLRSIGSCSFEEPVGDLRRMEWIR
jgi:hypothetical protein